MLNMIQQQAQIELQMNTKVVCCLIMNHNESHQVYIITFSLAVYMHVKVLQHILLAAFLLSLLACLSFVCALQFGSAFIRCLADRTAMDYVSFAVFIISFVGSSQSPDNKQQTTSETTCSLRIVCDCNLTERPG